MTMPSILVVLLVPTWPARNGIGRRLEAITEQLASVADVTVVSFLPSGVGPQRPPAHVSHVRVTRPTGKVGALAGMVTALAAGRPLTSAFYRRRSVRRWLHQHLRSARPDIVLVHGVGGAALLRGLFPPGRTMLDLADAEHERVRSVGAARGLRGLPYQLDGARVADWCVTHLDEYKCVSVVSAADRMSYEHLAPAARLMVVPNGIRPAANLRTPVPGRVLFLGDLHYPPNQEGLGWFIREVLPLCPDELVLRVVGQGAVAGNDPRIVRLGFVESLTEELARAALMIVPIKSGGGTRIKALEAFASGIPVVSTSFGVDGLGALPNLHYALAETPEEFASALCSVGDDPLSAIARADAARQLVEQNFTWSRCTSALVTALTNHESPQ